MSIDWIEESAYVQRINCPNCGFSTIAVAGIIQCPCCGQMDSRGLSQKFLDLEDFSS